MKEMWHQQASTSGAHSYKKVSYPILISKSIALFLWSCGKKQNKDGDGIKSSTTVLCSFFHIWALSKRLVSNYLAPPLLVKDMYPFTYVYTTLRSEGCFTYVRVPWFGIENVWENGRAGFPCQDEPSFNIQFAYFWENATSLMSICDEPDRASL